MTMTEVSKYLLETLWEDEEIVLSRGVRTGHPTILAVTPAKERPPPGNLRQFQHAYALRGELEPAWAAAPIAMEHYDGRPALLMYDPGGDPLNRFLGRPLEIAQFLRLAIGIAAALGSLHSRGMIHRNIKPPNILVNPTTGEAWFWGVCLALRVPRQRPAAEPPTEIAGTLAYMAPEQTGRMNRSIDSRSDLYAYGVTLYEMLTGSLPFTASDPVELIHCHVARQPVPPAELVGGVPEPISAVIMKLLAKIPEERYQTAAGVQADLRTCLAAWEAAGQIGPISLGKRDVSNRIMIPEKLYGREPEIELLLSAFDRVRTNRIPELVLLSGYSGVGKSSIVHEMHKHLIPRRGLFASGKFDQYKKDIPYATLAQAFQTLIHQILGKSEGEVKQWRRALWEAVGRDGRLIAGLIPELELIIGNQSAASELSVQDAQNHFKTIFRRFLAVFANPEHPLVLFLDDLQWIDAATLELVGNLVVASDIPDLLLIGAYRDNEVGPFHPLSQMLRVIGDSRSLVQEIAVRPLSIDHLTRLVIDSLHCEIYRADSLARLMHEKTGGNPFFTIQFFTVLADEGLLFFDPDVAVWRWDLERIRTKSFTENVADLMAEKLERLPCETKEVLKRLACFGHQAGTQTLSSVLGRSEEALHAAMFEAIGAGLCARHDGGYAFTHDRVQEAAYTLIPETQRPFVHLQIGRLLATPGVHQKFPESVFDAVSQLNRGAAMIDSQEEKTQVAELNLVAGKRAKTSTAYASALSYFIAGEELLTPSSWTEHYELAFGLALNAAECEFLTGNVLFAEERLSRLSILAANQADRAAIACLRVAVSTARDRPDDAVEVCLDYLRHLGVHWSPHPPRDAVEREFEQIWANLGSRSIDELARLPLMTDSIFRATIDVLTAAMPSAWFIDENLHDLFAAWMVNLSLANGNSDGSSYAYAVLGTILGSYFGDYQSGYRFCKLGLKLVEEHKLDGFKARVYVCFGHHILPWTEHVQKGRPWLLRAQKAAEDSGDLVFAAFSRGNLVANLLAAGDPLSAVEQEAEDALGFAKKMDFGLVADFITGQLRFIRTLRGLTPSLASFNDEEFDEAEFEQHLEGDAHLAMATCRYWMRKLQARFLAGEYSIAVEAAFKAKRFLSRAQSFLEVAEFHFYSGLAHAACHGPASPPQRSKHLEALLTHARQMEIWNENCPENFRCCATLLAAEIARIQARELDAERLYEQAIQSAREQGFIQNEAIAYEIAARFYSTRGFETIANAYLKNARYCYLCWGALAKVRQLDLWYPRLNEERISLSSVLTIGTPVADLDVGTLVKASQAVFSEIVLEKLIEALLRIAVEHAGARRGLLIIVRNHESQIEAEARTAAGKIEVALRQATVTGKDLPESVLHYVIRTRESVILADASIRHLFSGDDYFRWTRTKSILCLPIVKQAQLVGVLYLENNLTTGAFTSSRIAVLELLAAQAAVSLEHALLYADLQRENTERKRAQEELRRSKNFLAEGQKISHTGSWGWNVSTGKLVWSDEQWRIFGLNPSQISPTLELLTERVHPEDRSFVQERLNSAISERNGFDLEHRILLPDGSIRYVQSVGRHILNPSGEVDDYIGTTMDITDRKRAAEELQRHEASLRKAQSELAHISRLTTMGELAASIAHEVSQPVGAIANNASACLRLLSSGSEKFQEMEDGLLDVLKGANRVNSIVQRMRALAKKVPPEMSRLDLRDVITDVLSLLDHELTKRQVVIRAELPEDLPPVLGDRVQLQQVVLNLVINGVEAINEVAGGERKISIGVRADQQNGRSAVHVSVQDSGLGLNLAEADRLFETFYTTKAQGLGMGLAISFSIIEAHGGRLWVARTDGRGATFEFLLPATD
jgi:PAS domain S-box-containing protein